jgi:prepilin peptidase CpaA
VYIVTESSDAVPAIRWILLVVLCVCAVTDVTRGKIYNWVTYPAALAVAIGLALQQWWTPDSAATMGLSFWQSLVGGAACFLVMFVLWNVGAMGGGDVKLATVMGLYLGLPLAMTVLMLALVLAGALLVCRHLWYFGILDTLYQFWREFRSAVGLSRGDSAAYGGHVPLALYCALAYALVIFVPLNELAWH